MTWFRCVDKSGSPTPPTPVLPSWIGYADITPAASTDTLVVPYDNTKTILNVLLYTNVSTLTANYVQTGLCGHKKVNDSTMVRLGATTTDYQGNDGFSGYGSVTVDEVNGTVTFVSRGGNYVFRHDTPYRALFIYEET